MGPLSAEASAVLARGGAGATSLGLYTCFHVSPTLPHEKVKPCFFLQHCFSGHEAQDSGGLWGEVEAAGSPCPFSETGFSQLPPLQVDVIYLGVWCCIPGEEQYLLLVAVSV